MQAHVGTKKHQAAKLRQSSAIGHFQDIADVIMKSGLPPGANCVPLRTAAWRYRVVEEMLKKGVPIATIDVFRPLFEEFAKLVAAPANTLTLVSHKHLFPYIDFVAQRLHPSSFPHT